MATGFISLVIIAVIALWQGNLVRIIIGLILFGIFMFYMNVFSPTKDRPSILKVLGFK